MGTRVSQEELISILDLEGNPNIFHFCEDAHLLVEETLVAASVGYSEARLKMIEKYLAAHLYTLAKDHGGIVQEKTGNAEATYRTVKGSGFASTTYGEMALGADTSGLLAALTDTKKTALFRVV